MSRPSFEDVAGDVIPQPGFGGTTPADAHERDEPQLWVVWRAREKPRRDQVEPIGADQGYEFAAVTSTTRSLRSQETAGPL